MLTLLLTAFAAPTPDVSVQWIEPTCSDEALADAARARSASVCGAAKVDHISFSYRTSRQVAGCEVWLSAWCGEGKPVPFQATGTVTMPTAYPDKDWAGVALALTPGEYDLAELPFPGGGSWNDKLDSVKIPAGYTVRACSDPRGMGRCVDLAADHNDLGMVHVGHDSASSLQVVKGTLPPLYACPRLFHDDNFRGTSWDICEDAVDLTGSSWNDKLSSLLVPPGWTVEICANPRFEAPCKIVTTDLARISGAVGADQTSSVRLTKP